VDEVADYLPGGASKAFLVRERHPHAWPPEAKCDGQRVQGGHVGTVRREEERELAPLATSDIEDAKPLDAADIEPF
jgi:hypothetical protein